MCCKVYLWGMTELQSSAAVPCDLRMHTCISNTHLYGHASSAPHPASLALRPFQIARIGPLPHGPTFPALLVSHTQFTPHLLPSLQPPLKEEQFTPGLARLVERCLTWNPTERPSFREVLHALENEYKVVRGKAAAVPRCDSAASMVMLNSAQQQARAVAPTGTDAAALHPALALPAAGAGNGNGNGNGGPGAQVQQQAEAAAPGPHMPAQVAHAMGTQAQASRASGLASSPVSPMQPHHGHAHHLSAPPPPPPAEGERTSGNHMSRFGPGGHAAAPGQVGNTQHNHHGHPGHNHSHGQGQAGETGVVGEAGTPAHGHPHHHAHHASQQVPGHAGHVVKLGRVRGHRMQRARSTPLPAHMMWFEGAEEDSDDTSGASNALEFDLSVIPEHLKEHCHSGTDCSSTATGTAAPSTASTASTRDTSPARHHSGAHGSGGPGPAPAPGLLHPQPQLALASPSPVRVNILLPAAPGVASSSSNATASGPSAFAGFNPAGLAAVPLVPGPMGLLPGSSVVGGVRLGSDELGGDDVVGALRFGHTTWGLHMITELQDEGVTPSATPQPSAPSSLVKHQGTGMVGTRHACTSPTQAVPELVSPVAAPAAGLEGATSGAAASLPAGDTSAASLSAASSGHTGAFFSPFAAALSQELSGFGSAVQPAKPSGHQHSLSAFSPFSASGLQQEAFGRRSSEDLAPGAQSSGLDAEQRVRSNSTAQQPAVGAHLDATSDATSDATMVTIDGLAIAEHTASWGVAADLVAAVTQAPVGGFSVSTLAGLGSGGLGTGAGAAGVMPAAPVTFAVGSKEASPKTPKAAFASPFAAFAAERPEAAAEAGNTPTCNHAAPPHTSISVESVVPAVTSNATGDADAMTVEAQVAWVKV